MKHCFRNLKLRYKLLYCMVSITTISLLTICLFSYHFFYQRNKEDALSKAENSVQMLTSTLSTQFNSMALNTASTLVSEPFPTIITNITHGKHSSFVDYYAPSDKALSLLRKNNTLISTAMLYGSDGTFFDETILGLSKNPTILFPENIWKYSDITVLPMRTNTLLQRGYTIPIIFPISSMGYGDNSMLHYADIAGSPKTRFILLLNAGELQSYFDRFSTLSTYCIYLADKNGYPLSLDSSMYPHMFDSKMVEFSSSHHMVSNMPMSIGNTNYYVSQRELTFCNLKIVHIIQDDVLSQTLRPILIFMVEIWVISILFAVLLSLIISHFLTKPFASLTDIIYKINQNTYQQKTQFSYHDEVGILGNQLNSMYDTIQLQIEQIKEEEQKKARAEIQMLSEQINPHFLYNTLECIHFQILNQHTSVASAMLESLGQYLRITLSSGDSMIPFHKEISHVTAYMQIMNRHSSSGIHFTCHIDSILEHHLILKMLLQPLVENSIKHGFSQNLLNNPLTPPEISITISLKNLDSTFTSAVSASSDSSNTEEEKQNKTQHVETTNAIIRIEVTDNGSGIDIEKARACLTANTNTSNSSNVSNERRHFGLNNIYRRLTATYSSRCSIDFTSIPYFRNCVIIEIPYLPENTPK